MRAKHIINRHTITIKCQTTNVLSISIRWANALIFFIVTQNKSKVEVRTLVANPRGCGYHQYMKEAMGLGGLKLIHWYLFQVKVWL